MSAELGKSNAVTIWASSEEMEAVARKNFGRLKKIRRRDMAKDKWTLECPNCDAKIPVEGGGCKKVKCLCGFIIQGCAG